MAIEKINIQNFTVFKEIEIKFSDGINVFIGENGTGKTHLMKVLYSEHNFDGTLQRPFFGFTSYKEAAKVFGISERAFSEITKKTVIKASNHNNRIIFIPAKDMLTHSRGLLEMAEKYSKDMPFDKTLLDIIKKAKQWKVNTIPDIAKNTTPILENIMNGTVVIENDTFFIEKRSGEKVDFNVEAEGIKKIGLLWQLLMNENITKGTVLLWDEPEANLNPKLIPDLVEILLTLSRNGVQTFLATHDYILAKYIEVRRKENDTILFHSLYKENGSVQCESNVNFRDLRNNSIISSFDKLLDEVYFANVED